MPFPDFNRRTRQILIGVWVAGAASLVGLVGWPVLHGDTLELGLPVLTFIVLTTTAELFAVTFEGRYEIAVSTVFLVAAIIVFRREPELIALTTGISVFAANLILRKPWYKVAFNVAMALTTVALSYSAFRLIGWEDVPHLVAAGAALMVVYFAADTTALTLLLSALEGRRFSVTYINENGQVTLEFVGMECFGVLFAVIWTVSPWLTPLFALPVIVLRQAYFQVERLRTESVDALGAIADIIENRDLTTHDHTESVSLYSRRLAERLGLSPEDVEQIAVAGRVHDLGKIAISDAILLKPGPLAPNEMERMREHCRVGYDILGHFSTLPPVARLIRAHHERYDGRGYPDGLAGSNIPIGAAVIAVADAFDAMTSDRPYRKAMPVQKAIDVLRQGLGTQWHPVVGATFIQLLLEDEARGKAKATSELRVLPDVSA